MVIAGFLADATPIWLEEQMRLYDGIVVGSVDPPFLAVKRWRSIQRQRLTELSLQMERLTVTFLGMKRALMFLRGLVVSLTVGLFRPIRFRLREAAAVLVVDIGENVPASSSFPR